MLRHWQKAPCSQTQKKNRWLPNSAAYTGFGKDYILKANLRVTEPQFTEELLRDSSLTVGRLDARYKGVNQNLLSENAFTDPQSDQISPAFIASFLSYFYDELKVNKNLNYHTSAYSAEGFNWNWSRKSRDDNSDPTSPNTAVDLAEAMSKNPNLKILVMNGYYDLATPFFAAEYTFNHMGLSKTYTEEYRDDLLSIRAHDVHSSCFLAFI